MCSGMRFKWVDDDRILSFPCILYSLGHSLFQDSSDTHSNFKFRFDLHVHTVNTCCQASRSKISVLGGFSYAAHV